MSVFIILNQKRLFTWTTAPFTTSILFKRSSSVQRKTSFIAEHFLFPGVFILTGMMVSQNILPFSFHPFRLRFIRNVHFNATRASSLTPVAFYVPFFQRVITILPILDCIGSDINVVIFIFTLVFTNRKTFR